ncbi:MAG: succinyl-diaminopimelate desuccinylase [Rickettsiales bacterium]|nr:succinyl-diaminopimelate desuccinylase [Rickettsiales bacterium]
MPYPSLEIASSLISFKSVSGEKDEGAILFIKNFLSDLGFNCFTETFTGSGSYEVENLYAEIEIPCINHSKNLCFAGHTDVVPEGDLSKWSINPYKPEVKNGFLIGRGAVDMKGSIACFMSAVKEYLQESSLEKSSSKNKAKISFLITGDEEADSINGTEKMLKAIYEKGFKIDSCIVGEPTNSEKIGDTIKIGRRGGVSFELKINGVQGHVAYPEKAKNPVPIVAEIVDKLSKLRLDNGNDFFQPSNLEVTTIDVGNSVVNLIPSSAKAKMNIRFNNEQTAISVKQKIEEIIQNTIKNYNNSFTYELTQIGRVNESFVFPPSDFANLIAKSSEKFAGIKPEFTTTGGTSDARFIKNYCEVAEFGLINTTAHKIDEKIAVSDLETLKNIYLEIIKGYFH